MNGRVWASRGPIRSPASFPSLHRSRQRGPGDPGLREPHSFRFWTSCQRTDPASCAARHTRCSTMLGSADRADVRAALLAHGEQRQLELAMALATGADGAVARRADGRHGPGGIGAHGRNPAAASRATSVTMLLVEHDMDVVFTLADRVTVLVLGCPIATGTPEAIRSDRGCPPRLSGGGRVMLELRKVSRPIYGRSQVLFGLDLFIGVRRGRDPDEAQRHGQDDDGALDHGIDARTKRGSVRFPRP